MTFFHSYNNFEDRLKAQLAVIKKETSEYQCEFVK